MKYFDMVTSFHHIKAKEVPKIIENNRKKITELYISTCKRRLITVPQDERIYREDGLIVHNLSDYTKANHTFDLVPNLVSTLDSLIMRGDKECVLTLTHIEPK